MIALLRIIRFPNLIVIAITQWVLAKGIFAKEALENGIEIALVGNHFLLLVLATLSISAAAYCINDVLDYPIDLVNHPEKVIVGKQISQGTVYWLIMSFVIFGFICALILAFEKDEMEWLWLYPFFTLVLGGYSRVLKMRPFIGNLVIAFSCAGVAGLIWLAERVTWLALPQAIQTNISQLIIVFLIYAFIATWIREIIKDLEDNQGDIIGGRKTLPIAYGVVKTKYFVHLLAAILFIILLINAFYWAEGSNQLAVLCLSSGLMLFLIYLQRLLFLAVHQSDYHQLSTFWKLFMLGGLLLLLLYQI